MEVDFRKVFELLDTNKAKEAKKYLLLFDFENFMLEEKLNYLNVFGYVLCELKDFDSARGVYDSYLNIALENNEKEFIHIAYHQLAMVERLDKRYEKAYGYIEKEEKLIYEYFSDDKLKYAVNLYEKGYIKFKLGDFDKAKIYMNESLDYALNTDDDVAKACAYRGIGEIYKEEDKELSDYNFDKAYRIFKELGDEKGSEEVLELKMR